jgi:hypothetical protein
MDRFMNGDWRPLVIKLDGLRQRLERFKLDTLWKATDHKMAYAHEIQKEREFLTEYKKKVFNVLAGPFLQMSEILSEIRVRLAQERNPPLDDTELSWLEIVEEDCRRWGDLETEADGWIALLETRSLEMEDSLWEAYAASTFRVTDKENPPRRSGRDSRSWSHP